MAIEINKAIDQGAIEIPKGISWGDIPSAWIKTEQLNRNRRAYNQAIKAVEAKLRNEYGQLYRRDGQRFVKFDIA